MWTGLIVSVLAGAAVQGAPGQGFELVARLGEEGVEGPRFGRLGDFETGDDGSLYVVDVLDQQVTRVTPSGSVANRIGRRGAGPGEFQRAVDLVWTRGRLWVADGSSMRVSEFLPDGRLITDRPIESPLTYSIMGLAPLAGGRTLVATSPRTSPTPGREDLRIHVVVVDSLGESADTVATYHSGIAKYRVDGQGRWQGVPLASYGTGGDWATHGVEQVAIADGYRGVVRFFRVEKEALVESRSVDLGLVARAIAAEELEPVRDWVREMADRTARPAPREIEVEAPPLNSRFGRMFFSAEGDLWISERRIDAGAGPGDVSWRVLPRGNDQAMPVTLPRGFVLRAVRGSRFYGSRRGDLDEAIVEIWTNPALAEAVGSRRAPLSLLPAPASSPDHPGPASRPPG